MWTSKSSTEAGREETRMSSETSTALTRIAVAGNPNAGKTTLFNRLTGLHQKVGNYPGVTVERKEGAATVNGVSLQVLDLPGAYSLTAHSPDEEVARDILFGWQPDCPPPDAVLMVVDSTNLERNLFLATQILELGCPCVLALNMVDVAERRGTVIDYARLEELLGVPVVPTVALTGQGADALDAALLAPRVSPARAPLKPAVAREVEALSQTLSDRGTPVHLAHGIAVRLLASPTGLDDAAARYSPELAAELSAARDRLTAEGLAWQGCDAGSRYRWLRELVAACVTHSSAEHAVTTSDKLDRVLTHRFVGPLLFALVMAAMFQSIYTWAAPFMDGINHATDALKNLARAGLPPGVLTDLLCEGVLTGVGAVMVFLPQIVFLFFFLCLLEESGYMARAAFVMDRLMSRVGLHGRSFVPLLSSFACAIPGIMAARTIASKRDRLVTILVAPLMTCSARLPVYALLIAAFVPQRRLFGVLSAQGLALLSLYALGVCAALVLARIFKSTLLRGPTPALLIELPPYRWPNWPNLLRELWQRAFLFVRFAGTLILSISIVLWFLAAFPHYEAPAGTPAATAGELQLEHSYLGRAGHFIEPVVRPLGFDWRIGVGLISSTAAREVMVSTLGVVFAVGEKATHEDQSLKDQLRAATWPDGRPLFTPACVAALLVFFVFACQCMSTVAVVVRETGTWRWAAFMVCYLGVLAYGFTCATYQGLRALGYG